MSHPGFAVPGDTYDRFIGRYSRSLAPRFLDFAGVEAGPVLDVGCGPGALAAEAARRMETGQVAAIDPSESFVAACRARVPGADVRLASAEALPFADDAFAGALAQLVLTFVPDPPRALAEVVRVTRTGGTVAACTFAGDGFAMARAFWQAAARIDPQAPDDARLPFRRAGELRELWSASGLREIQDGVIALEGSYEDFDDLWGPFAAGIGPMGSYLARQPEERRVRIREGCREILRRPTGPFTLPARVIAIRGRVP